MEHKSSLLTPRAAASLMTLDEAIEHEIKHGRPLNPNMDTRTFRRTISNRLSAQRSRIKKARYITKMEKMVKDLEDLIKVITPQVDSYKERKELLIIQNDSLKKLVELRTNESKLAEIELERKQAEVSRLRELESVMNNDGGELSGTSFSYYQNGVQLGLNMETNSGSEQHGNDHQVGANDHEEADIDQYINFEQLNVDQAGASE